jgi:hypothetical protein
MVQFIIKVMPRKGSMYDKSKQVNDEFPNFPKKILVGLLNKKSGRGNTFNPACGKESLH